ncbi:SET domain-containing protein 5 [Leucoagaricus sp. SymC.cos]|nr:SET domain-containing protein 5 [Leucoagaricus sp. SymC.cos]
MLIVTTIPMVYIGEPLDADGHSEWIVQGPTKAKVLNAPGYPSPVPKPSGHRAYEIKETEKTGMGVFAKRDIKRGELIFAERPLLVSPSNIAHMTDSLPSGYDMRTMQLIIMHEWEKKLEFALSRMTPENQEAFKALANNHKEDGSGPLLGICRTNAYGIEELYDGDERNVATSYAAVLKTGSRINHSCMPNVDHSFSIPSFSFKFHATLDIKAGEQLFFSYCGTDQSKAERHAELAPYGVVCDCPACEHATPETDQLRKDYRNRVKEYTFKISQWVLGSGMIEESRIDEVLKFRGALIKEGLHMTSDYKALVLMIQLFYEKLGLKEKAQPFKEEYVRYKLK